MTDLAPSDHVRPEGTGHPDGVYRVIGTDGEAVTLLRVTDADGRRRNTGEVIHVDAATVAGFGRAENPDAGFSPLATVREGFEGLWIRFRVLVGR